MKQPAIYIITNQRNGTLYTGVTSNLIQRIWQHKSHLIESFSKKYKLTQLVYFESHPTMEVAIAREKELKGFARVKKIALIEAVNPYWNDLYNGLL